MEETGDNGVFYDGEQAPSAPSHSVLHLIVLEAGALCLQLGRSCWRPI